MQEKQTVEAIDPAIFDETLEAYARVVPKKLLDLDKQRYYTIPQSVEKRTGTSFLTKDEVATLVDWKLSHGKFRPTLKSLVQQNTEETVQDITTDGFKAFTGSQDSAKTSLNILTKLKGIGPATASLLLSVNKPDVAPFFSDELFRWCFLQDTKGKGWDREIKYNLKEYLQLFERVQEVIQRFKAEHERDIRAVDIEKVAYVLGKRAASAIDEISPVPKGRSNKRKLPAEGGRQSGITGNDGLHLTGETADDRPVKRAAASRSTKAASGKK